MYQAIFQILREESSLDSIMSSYQLLKELDTVCNFIFLLLIKSSVSRFTNIYSILFDVLNCSASPGFIFQKRQKLNQHLLVLLRLKQLQLKMYDTLTSLILPIYYCRLWLSCLLLLSMIILAISQAWSPFIFGVDCPFTEKDASREKPPGSLDPSVGYIQQCSIF